MKKIFVFLLLIIAVMCFQAQPVNSYQLPRWQFFPIKVYIEEHPKKQIVRNAFDEWEARTHMAKFFYVDSDRKIPKIIVRFAENSSGTDHSNAVGVTYSFTPYGFYATANVVMYTNHPGTNIPLTDKEIHSVALHEIGHALGLKHVPDKNDIMYFQMNRTEHLTPNDLNQFFSIYKL